MPSPFPGMDPYLEDPRGFPDFHHEMISGIRAALTPLLRPKYRAVLEERVYVSDSDDPGRRFIIPDVEIRATGRRDRPKRTKTAATGVLDVAEPIVMTSLVDEEIHDFHLNIVDVVSKEVVTVIELLSPTNKCAGSVGRDLYMAKRRELTHSNAHFIEIDLLRDGKPTFDRDLLPPHDYAVHVSRVDMRPKGIFWPISMRQRLPIIEVPLKPKDPDVKLDLQSVFDRAYENAGYDLEIDYAKPPHPVLPKALRDWAAKLARKANGHKSP